MTPAPADAALLALYDVVDFCSQLKEGDDDKVWARIVDKLSVALDCEAATYYSYSPGPKHLIPRYAIGPRAGDLKGTPVDIRTGLCGWVAQRREPLLIPDCYADSRFLREVDNLTGFKTRDCLCVPLFDRLELAGVVQLLNKRVGVFSREDLKLVETCARVTATALRVIKLEATVDKVTARNASIIENLGGGFMAIDTHGRLILCNPAAKRILGLPPDLKMNQPAEQALLHCPKVSDILLDTLATRKTAKRQEFEWSFKGETRTLGYTTILIQDPQGELSGAGITFQDITKR